MLSCLYLGHLPVTVACLLVKFRSTVRYWSGEPAPGFVSQIRHNVEFTFTGICPDSTALPHALFLKQGPN